MVQGLINKSLSDGRTADHTKYSQQHEELLLEEDDVKKEQGRTEVRPHLSILKIDRLKIWFQKIAAGVTHINARSRNQNRKTEQAVLNHLIKLAVLSPATPGCDAKPS